MTKKVHVLVVGSNHTSLQSAAAINSIVTHFLMGGLNPDQILVANEKLAGSRVGTVEEEWRNSAEYRKIIRTGTLSGIVDKLGEYLKGDKDRLIKQVMTEGGDLGERELPGLTEVFEGLGMSEDIYKNYGAQDVVVQQSKDLGINVFALEKRIGKAQGSFVEIARSERPRIIEMTNSVIEVVGKRPEDSSTLIICNVGRLHTPTLTSALRDSFKKAPGVVATVQPVALNAADVAVQEEEVARGKDLWKEKDFNFKGYCEILLNI